MGGQGLVVEIRLVVDIDPRDVAAERLPDWGCDMLAMLTDDVQSTARAYGDVTTCDLVASWPSQAAPNPESEP